MKSCLVNILETYGVTDFEERIGRMEDEQLLEMLTDVVRVDLCKLGQEEWDDMHEEQALFLLLMGEISSRLALRGDIVKHHIEN